ncbi:MAG: hypothetical protein KC912_11200 [Proteobacteria bacterium]|nr:hypothetical protein [Pseudomonadota bacterium]
MFRTLSFAFALTLVAACGTTADEDCTDGAYQCATGEILEMCTDGAWAEEEDCASLGLMCHAEMGHCMAMDSGM